jgi:hypothetical protein
LEDPSIGGRIILKMDVREVGWWGMDWVSLAEEDKGRWWALVNTVMNLRVS